MSNNRIVEFTKSRRATFCRNRIPEDKLSQFAHTLGVERSALELMSQEEVEKLITKHLDELFRIISKKLDLLETVTAEMVRFERQEHIELFASAGFSFTG